MSNMPSSIEIGQIGLALLQTDGHKRQIVFETLQKNI